MYKPCVLSPAAGILCIHHRIISYKTVCGRGIIMQITFYHIGVTTNFRQFTLRICIIWVSYYYFWLVIESKVTKICNVYAIFIKVVFPMGIISD